MQLRVLALLQGVCIALTPASLKSYTVIAQGTHGVEIVRKDARGTQMFGSVRASFRPKLVRHQRHKGRNSTTVHMLKMSVRTNELDRIEPNTAVC